MTRVWERRGDARENRTDDPSHTCRDPRRGRRKAALRDAVAGAHARLARHGPHLRTRGVRRRAEAARLGRHAPGEAREREGATRARRDARLKWGAAKRTQFRSTT